MTDQPQKDISDWFDAGHTAEDLRQLLEEHAPPAPALPSSPARLQFRTPREIAQLAPETPDAVVTGMLVRGAMTELSAKIKTGKTTFMGHLIASVRSGHDFLGLKTKRTAFVVLTEERIQTMRAALGRVGLLDADDVHILSLYDAGKLPWPDIVAEAEKYAKEVGAGVIVVDTLTRWARIPSDDENSSGAAAEAIEPLEAAAAHGFAVLVIRHDRKSGGELGDSARGSSAFGGAADIILNLRRANTEGHESRRTLLGVGRFDDVPSQLTIEIQGGHYAVLGDTAAIERDETKSRLLDVLPGVSADPIREDDVLARLGTEAKRSTVRRALNDLVGDASVERISGLGTRGTAKGYRLGSRYFSDQPHTPGQKHSPLLNGNSTDQPPFPIGGQLGKNDLCTELGCELPGTHANPSDGELVCFLHFTRMTAEVTP